jgi:uncharacterized protein DUF6599
MMSNLRARHINRESLLGLCIIIILCIITAGILVVQGNYDERVFFGSIVQKSSIQTEAAETATSAAPLSSIVTEGYRSMGDAEIFDKETLSDKINGKAELYLEAGYESLQSMRFVNSEDSSNWFEFYSYNMGKLENAYSVFSLQRRKSGIPNDLAIYSYTTENAIFFVKEKYYIEIIAAKSLKEYSGNVENTAKNFIKSLPEEDTQEVFVLSLLPLENKIQNSEKLFLVNAFGYEKFNHLIQADYDIKGKKITGFAKECKNKEEAEQLSLEYHEFLLDIGADNIETESGVPKEFLISDIIGDIEIVFSIENMVAGIHAAPDKTDALKLSKQIMEFLKEKGRINNQKP